MCEPPMQTDVLHHGGGAALLLEGGFLYIAGGKGLVVFSVSADPRCPQKVGDVIDTQALSHTGGCSLKLIDGAKGEKLM